MDEHLTNPLLALGRVGEFDGPSGMSSGTLMQGIASPEWIEGGGPFGEFFCSYVPADHQGCCAMSYFSGEEQHWAIFPSRDIAMSSAMGACRRDVGGYENVAIHPVAAAAVGTTQYDDVAAWQFEGERVWDGPPEEPRVAAIVRCLMRELIREIDAHPKELAAVEWRDLERLLFEVLEGLGYKTELTRSAKDGGYDLRLEAEGSVYFVEVKHWSERSKVGIGIVNRFTEIVVAQGGEGLLISTSGFTSEVVKGRIEVSRYPVLLGSHLKVLSLCRCYVQNETGLWVRTGGLRDALFEGAF